MLRELFLGFIRVHILYHASLNPVYGLELMEELARHGYPVGPGTMYPILNKLEENGLLVSEKINVEGKLRKYYRITEAGGEVLAEAKEKIRELAREVLEER
ncbi:MAG: PadR family transcriptional regulator [Firmicutes bacterium]|uniref:DNA-binding transcriptional regulator, PadR family n=1 Tax=Desulforamulus putei DSM 12395 TaxID=1121429 RepID=A0A1M4XLR8_9FIRM|nr:PadR family transcriptional regulator [Desulforamulus putei]MCL5780757.1 PadR family transcriptional regulator [Bacillota bacterium]SHE94537.1 DNA-binding transcriptional regulator, PadR family [Desulforamulus putei DSM 12395]